MPAVKSAPAQIDALMEDASQALAQTRYFEAERLAVRALGLARQADEWDRLARLIMPLQEARRQRLQLALEVPGITVIAKPVDEEISIEPGCYLVQPPQVGADARRLRILALEREIPIAVVCREPRTQIGLCPIVAIGPGVTVREKIHCPSDPENVDIEWFLDAMEAIGDAAIDQLDPELAILKRVDALIGRLEAIPEHEELHQALVDACRAAEQQEREGGPEPRRRRRTKS